VKMRRVAIVSILGVVLALAMVATTGATTATAHRPLSGILAGEAVWAEHGNHGVVKVIGASGRVVARRLVKWHNDHFHFALKPGRYKVVLVGAWPNCPNTKVVRVRANHTTQALLSEGCENSY
jgi:hypothetical protein